MSFPIVINSSNVVSSNTFAIDLPTAIDLNDYDCSLGTSYMYNSVYNISTFLNNNSFTIIHPKNAGSDTISVTLPDGGYNISDLNSYLQYILIQNGKYIVNNTTGQNTYYCAFVLSPTSYQVQFISYVLPSSLPAGYSNPGGMTFPAAANQVPQLTVLSTNNFKDIIGFSPATYPSSSTSTVTVTSSSNYVPNVNPISAIQFRLSCLLNNFSSNSQLLHVGTFSGSAIGELVNMSPVYPSYVPCQGTHKTLTLSFYDQLGRPLGLLDPNIVVKIVFKKKSTPAGE